MVTFPCPWCEHEVVLTAQALLTAQTRCEDCATLVELAWPATETEKVAPLAA